MSIFVPVIKLTSFSFSLVMLAVFNPKKLLTGGGGFDLELLLNLDVCTGILKFEAFFAKKMWWG